MKDSWSPTLQSQQSCSWSTQTFHPCRLSWAESSSFLHPASSDQNHHLCATAHCCSSRETEGVIKTEKYFIVFKPSQGCYVSSSGILQRPRWTTEHLREMEGTEYWVLIVLMLWLPALTLSAPSCRNSALSRITGTRICPFCASPFPEGTTAVLASTGY